LKTLVVGPFLGELEWEVSTWIPYINNMRLLYKYDSCIVYGKSDRGHLYSFATEYIDVFSGFFDTLIPYMGFLHVQSNNKDIINQRLANIHRYIKLNTKDTDDFFWYSDSFQPNTKSFMMGRPHLVTASNSDLCTEDVLYLDFFNENTNINESIDTFNKYKLVVCRDSISPFVLNTIGKPFIKIGTDKEYEIEQSNFFGNIYKVLENDSNLNKEIEGMLNIL
jgi:hypothetical protein